MKTPVLFIIFNKHEETKQVFETIRKQKPNKFFISADGPRESKIGEAEKCQYIRKWVIDHIDWPCEIKTLFRDKNVGCGRGPSEAISWFFEYVEEGIILEDDCLPNESFFSFCEELLDRYQFNNNISIVSGNNFQKVQPMFIDADYYFSIFPSSNGWATWRRSWHGFDYHIRSWPAVNKQKLSNFLFRDKRFSGWWLNFFNQFYKVPRDDAWDYQFHYHCMTRYQLALIPKANLVKNIGYSADATHSQDPDNYFANVPTHDFSFPLTHPSKIERNYEADEFIQSMLFGQVEVISLHKRIKRSVKFIMKLVGIKHYFITMK